MKHSNKELSEKILKRNEKKLPKKEAADISALFEVAGLLISTGVILEKHLSKSAVKAIKKQCDNND